jgi:hypothetical protein
MSAKSKCETAFWQGRRGGAMVGTPRCGVPARAAAGGTNYAHDTNCALRCAADARRGRRSAPSLPFKLRTFAVGKIDEWPIFRTGNQILADRVLQNVISLFASTLVVSQSMLEKIALPPDT